jgi:coenzyme F420-0:L-glutamate ligase / coenzyme F420-1:gamma-L-glutamate ligase
MSVVPLQGMPMFAPGMSVAAEVLAAARRMGEPIGAGDVVVVAQKIVSKAEGRLVRLGDVAPSEAARELAAKSGREPAFAQLILDESIEILRATPAAVIARHRCGHVLANAGIDASNVEGGDDDTVLLWPLDPDASARAIRAELGQHLPGTGRGTTQKAVVEGSSMEASTPPSAASRLPPPRPGEESRIAVVIADSLGRAWRIGTVGQAIGCAGLTVLDDQRGKGQDLFGRTLQATVIAIADAVAAMAVLAMGEASEGTPAALVRGAGKWVGVEDGPGAGSVVRPMAEDMFR